MRRENQKEDERKAHRSVIDFILSGRRQRGKSFGRSRASHFALLSFSGRVQYERSERVESVHGFSFPLFHRLDDGGESYSGDETRVAILRRFEHFNVPSRAVSVRWRGVVHANTRYERNAWIVRHAFSLRELFAPRRTGSHIRRRRLRETRANTRCRGCVWPVAFEIQRKWSVYGRRFGEVVR